MARIPFFESFDVNKTKQRLRAVLDEDVYEPIRPDLAGFESYVYGQGYIWELPRNLRVLSAYKTMRIGEKVFGSVVKQKERESDADHDRRLAALFNTAPGQVPFPMTTLEISTALRLLMSPRMDTSKSKEPIKGTTVGRMLDLIGLCQRHSANPGGESVQEVADTLKEFARIMATPAFQDRLAVEKARAALRTATRNELRDAANASAGDDNSLWSGG